MTLAPLALAALDPDDLDVVSTFSQDALIQAQDLRWLEREHRFVLVMRRFDWDAPESEPRRRLTGLHFERVLGVAYQGFDPRGGVLSLLAITFEETQAPSGYIRLAFSGGGGLRLEVECVEAQLRDLGPAWEASARPSHPLDQES